MSKYEDLDSESARQEQRSNTKGSASNRRWKQLQAQKQAATNSNQNVANSLSNNTAQYEQRYVNNKNDRYSKLLAIKNALQTFKGGK